MSMGHAFNPCVPLPNSQESFLANVAIAASEVSLKGSSMQVKRRYQELYLAKVDDVGGKRGSRKALSLIRVMQEAILKREQSLFAHLDLLHYLPLLPVPEGQHIAVCSTHDVLHLEALHNPEIMRTKWLGSPCQHFHFVMVAHLEESSDNMQPTPSSGLQYQYVVFCISSGFTRRQGSTKGAGSPCYRCNTYNMEHLWRPTPDRCGIMPPSEFLSKCCMPEACSLHQSAGLQAACNWHALKP